MVPGFNHNIQHKGRVFHIQTEDSGLQNPHIVTLLYIAGTIIGKKKTHYDELVQMDGISKIVKDLMEEQHKSMLRDVVRGNFDQLAESVEKGKPPVPQSMESVAKKDQVVERLAKKGQTPAASAAPAPAAVAPAAPAPVVPPVPAPAKAPTTPLPSTTPAAAPTKPASSSNDLASLFGSTEGGEKSLDEIILSYLAEDKPQ